MHTRLEKRKKLGNLRALCTTEALIDFASNDYLGLARSALLHDKVLEKLNNSEHKRPLFGSTGSRLLTGNFAYTEMLEAKIATFHSFESGLLFNSGYMANVGLIASCLKASDILLFDAHIHASMQAGMRLCQAARFPFRHNDAQHLEERLKRISSKEKCYVLIESVYGTDGSLAPLREIATLCSRYGAKLIVDEAHAVGLFGKEGKGLVFEYKLQEQVFAQITTFGKALGTHGAVVLTKKYVKEYLINFASSFIYTTALPLCNQFAISAAYDLLPLLDAERAQLFLHIKSFQNFCTSKTQIQPIPVKGNAAAYHLQQKLKDAGFDVRALVSPTVRRGCEILRLSLHAFNTQEEMQRVQEVLKIHA